MGYHIFLIQVVYEVSQFKQDNTVFPYDSIMVVYIKMIESVHFFLKYMLYFYDKNIYTKDLPEIKLTDYRRIFVGR